jgi:hypothetical protein
MKAWFPIGKLQNKVGIITDIYSDYVEVFEQERKEYYIIHVSEIILI